MNVRSFKYGSLYRPENVGDLPQEVDGDEPYGEVPAVRVELDKFFNFAGRAVCVIAFLALGFIVWQAGGREAWLELWGRLRSL